MNPIRVLMIEDHVDLAALGVRFLQSAGFEVVLAQTGQEGLDLLVKFQPSVVFLDLTMPDMRPEEMLQSFQSLLSAQNIPFVLVSGNADIKEWARQFKTPYYLLKPYFRNQLIEACLTAIKDNETSG